jgi:hypothetical protein
LSATVKHSNLNSCFLLGKIIISFDDEIVLDFFLASEQLQHRVRIIWFVYYETTVFSIHVSSKERLMEGIIVGAGVPVGTDDTVAAGVSCWSDSCWFCRIRRVSR